MFEKLIDACYFRLAMMIPMGWCFWPWRDEHGFKKMTPLGRFEAAAYGYFAAKDAGFLTGLPWRYHNSLTAE